MHFYPEVMDGALLQLPLVYLT